MNYVRGVLSGLAAIFIAEFVFAWPSLRGTKATGLALFAASPLSPRFWIVGILLFGLFFAASRLHSKLLRLLLFWTPATVISTLGLGLVALIAYAWLHVPKG
jgi:hypothetical protein